MREAPDGSGEPSEQPFAVEAALTGGQQYTSARSCPLDRGILGVLVVFLSCLVFNEVLLVRGGVGGNGVRRGIIARSRFSSSSEGGKSFPSSAASRVTLKGKFKTHLAHLECYSSALQRGREK